MDFGSILTAMITPYTASGAVDYKKAQKLAQFLLANGTDTLVICGTTGECPTLTQEEKIGLLQAVVEVARGHVIYGTTGNNTATSLQVTADAERYGADGVLAVVPYYNKPPQQGMFEHFKTIADSTKLPVILYNIPSRTGANLQNATVERLAAACPNIVGIKDSTGSLAQLSDLNRRMGDNFAVYSGDDSFALTNLALGGKGIISVASHIVGNRMRDMVKAFAAGDTKLAAQIHHELTPAFTDLFITTNPIPVKAAMNLLGWDAQNCRLPLCAPTATENEQLRQLLSRYNLL